MVKRVSKKKVEEIPEPEKEPVYVRAPVYYIGGKIPYNGGKIYKIELRSQSAGKLHSGIKVSLDGKKWCFVN